jgi:hypothetical protein
MRRIRRHLTYANVMATLAAFGVLAGGGAYAASKIGAEDIKRNAIRTKHIRGGAVTKGKLAPSLRRRTEYARVRSDGTLVGGTATSATRLNEGRYQLRFAKSIRKCAAAANSASFSGYDLSVYRIWARPAIGSNGAGQPDPRAVVVDLFGSSGPNEDSSFTLVLACP